MTSGTIHKHKDKKSKKSHEKKVKKKKKPNKSVHGEEDRINYAEDSGEGNVDLSEELHPVGFYINDREEMINQMFSVIKGDKLRAMLPPVLKDSTIDELKSHCLDELLGMSSKRIHSILEGRELETSSESDDTSSNPENENTMGISPKDSKSQWSSDDMRAGTQDQDLEELDTISDERNGLLNGPVPDMDTLEIGITRKEMGELLNYMPPNRHHERKRTSSTCEAEPGVSVAKRSKNKASNRKKPKESEKQIKGTGKSTVEPDEVGSPSETGNVDDGDMTVTTDESKGKTLLEILELEMRARAIRALLKQQIGAGDGEDIELCDEESRTSPSEVKKSPSLNTLEDTASSCNHGFSKDNATGSNSFVTSPKSLRQNLKHKGMENMPLNQCTVNIQHTNHLCYAVSPKLSVDISAIHQLPSSTQNVELYSPKNTNHAVDMMHSELNRNAEKLLNEDDSQSSSCSNIKIEVFHGDKTQEPVPPSESNGRGQESHFDMAQRKEIETINTGVKCNEPDREDGELSNDDKSSESVLEVQSERCCNDIIILDDSDDGMSELHTSSKLLKNLVQQTDDSQKLSLENLPEQDNFSNDSSASTEISGILNTVSKECSIKPYKSSVSYETSGLTTENVSQNENNGLLSSFIETESCEHYRSENQNKRSDTSDCSWATRWLQSKDVQRVVSTSKMCAKIRKRMKSAQKVQKVSSLTIDPEESCKSSFVIVGSVNEYNMLDKPKSGDGESPENSIKSPEQNNS